MNTKRRAILLCCLLITGLAQGQTFEEYTQFPEPAGFSYYVLGTGLPDGRLILWNGDTVFVQHGPSIDFFHPVASGYLGDPAFIALSPNGHDVILGQGFGDNLYSFDVDAPADYTSASVITTIPHYGATFLSETLLLIDAGNAGFTGSELVMLDLSATKGVAIHTVVSKDERYEQAQEKGIIVEKPLFGWSAKLAYDEDNGLVYAMDSGQREIRIFNLTDILNAFNTNTPLDWATDGVLMGAAGDYFSGGVAGIRPDGTLIIDGSEGYLQPGGIQLVDPNLANPALAVILATLDPAGTQGFHAAIYNEYSDTITAIVDGVPFGETGEVAQLPISSPLVCMVLVLMLAYVGYRRTA